ncbi:MAG TPA: OmpA family protein [Kofleriaceae bacterium]|nr:OmpA family protein [Kofleriaceae bacterium]
MGGAVAATLAGCATAEMRAACQPSFSWAAPAFRCGAATPAEVAIKAPPAPEPEPTPAAPTPPPEPAAPPPEPPPTAKLGTEKIELSETVQFETNSARLVERSKTLLDDVVRELNEHPEVKRIQIEGHTDKVASKAYNLKLSKERADAVKAYLVNKGIPPRRLTVKAFGESKPIASNKTEEGRAQNRRVDFRILKH